MHTFSFTIILQDIDVMTDEIAEALVAAGCDDGSPFSGGGVAGVEFGREASSLQDAIASAVANVRKAGFQVARVTIDGQELADLEQLAGI